MRTALLAMLVATGAAAQNNPNNPPPPTISPETSNFRPQLSPEVPAGPSAPPGGGAPPLLRDEIARELNRTVGLAGALRREFAEGRGAGEQAGQLMAKILESRLGRRGQATLEERTADDEAWSQPYAEARVLLDDARHRREEAIRLPPQDQFQMLQVATEKISEAYRKLAEASRKRHAQAANSIRNVR